MLTSHSQPGGNSSGLQPSNHSPFPPPPAPPNCPQSAPWSSEVKSLVEVKPCPPLLQAHQGLLPCSPKDKPRWAPEALRDLSLLPLRLRSPLTPRPVCPGPATFLVSLPRCPPSERASPTPCGGAWEALLLEQRAALCCQRPGQMLSCLAQGHSSSEQKAWLSYAKPEQHSGSPHLRTPSGTGRACTILPPLPPSSLPRVWGQSP